MKTIKLPWLGFIFAVIALVSCKTGTSNVPIYGWYKWFPKEVSTDSLKTLYADWKSHGMVGVSVMINLGDFDVEAFETAAQAAHDADLEFHAWLPAMLMADVDSTWYTVNRYGKSAYNKEDRAYVEYYTTVDPHNPDVQKCLIDKYSQLADIPEVDYVQLDYIRYADVILSEGLWSKYDGQIDHVWRDSLGQVHEYPGADYCYCESCTSDFKAKTGIDIKAKLAEGVDPSTIKEWAQFRCDNVTELVNSICEAIHKKGKKVSADVFPGPDSYAVKMVRQQWNKWNCDVFFPMNYNDFYLKPASWIEEITREEVKSTDKPVYSGLFICQDWKNKKNIIDPEFSGLIPSEMQEAVDGAIKAGAKGICLFCPQFMTKEHWDAIEK